MDLLDILLGAKFGGGSGGGSGNSTFVPSFGTVASVSLGTTWSGNDPYTSTVTVTGYTATDKTMVSVLPSTAVLTQMLADGTSNIYITNNNGTLTATALGAAPTQAMTLTVLCSESDQAAVIGALPAIVGDGVIETLQAADLTDAVNQLGTDVSDVKNAISQKAPVIINTASGDIATFADGADDMPIKHLVANIEAVQSGTGDPSPENIRPISGWTGLTGARTGKNLVDISQFATVYSDRCTYAEGVLSFTSLATAMYTTGIPTRVPSGATLSWQITTGTAQNFRVRFGYVDGMAQTIPAATTTFVAPKEIIAIRIDYTASGTATLSNFMASVEPSDYVPYQGDTISVSWETEAGTVYGGTLDVITGLLTVNRTYRVLNDPNKWVTSSGTTAFQYTEDFSDRKLYSDSYTGAICSYVPVNASGTLYARWRGATSYRFGLVGDSSALATIQADASAGKIAICYDLATPIVYQLDPITVNTLLGNNTVYVDCGSVTVDYPTDTGIEVTQLSNAIDANEEAVADMQSMIATVEATTTASKNYAAGDLLVYDGKLYKVMSAIATGATIIVGSNVTQTTVESQIAAGGGGGGAVDDVQLNGSSIVSNGVADIKVGNGLRLGANADRAIMISEPNQGSIRTRSSSTVIIPSVQDISVFYGLAWAAGDRTQADSTDLSAYTDDAKSAIQTFLGVSGIIGTVEGATASKAYTVGDAFLHAGALYKATASIASGDAITPGTNCTQTTLISIIKGE